MTAVTPDLPLRYRAFIAFAAVLAALVCLTGAAHAAGMPVPPQTDTSLSPGESRSVVNVKLAEGSDVRLRGGRFVFQGGGGPAVDLNKALAGLPGLEVERLFSSATEAELAASQSRAQARSGREQPDMNLFFRVTTDGAGQTVALLEKLDALDIVESAAPEAKPVAPPATPNFTSLQGYRSGSAAGGIDALFAQTLPGGKGENVAIVDLEYSWNRAHEDLSKARLPGAALANGTACDPFGDTDHGTAVLGELAGDPNSLGVTGLAPGAALRTVNVSSTGAPGRCDYNLANAIKVATDNTSPGDVILIEQQTAGPNFPAGSKLQFGLVPSEWELPVWTAIRNATSLGRIVIEAAGNGSQNLDDPAYNDTTGRNWFSYDSGAIIVGAGSSPGCDGTIARGRLSFSNYGSRLNVQGWGNCVATTGYGPLQGAKGTNDAYTNRFGGTSSASPIVAASAAMLSSIAEQRGSTVTPAAVRKLLASTGQPQAFGSAGNIGPLPNLKAAIGKLGPKLAESGHVVSGAAVGATTVPVRQTWKNSGSAAVRYDVWLKTDAGDFVKQTLASPSAPAAVFDLERNHDYQFAARAVDADGVWSEWAYGKTFHLGEYQENYSAAVPAFTGTWTRSAWQPAVDGFLSVSGTPGDSASFSFTGNNVAWIATKANNRGQARVYVDGVLEKTVDLYSAANSARAIAFNRTWASSGNHTIRVEVVGTAGRPKVDVDAFVRLR